MSEPKRWLEEGAPPDLAPLLDAARREAPSSESLARALAAAGVVAAATTTSVTASAAGASGLAKATAPTLIGVSGLKWMVVGLGVGAASVAAVGEILSSEPIPAIAARRQALRPPPPSAGVPAPTSTETRFSDASRGPATRDIAEPAKPVLSPRQRAAPADSVRPTGVGRRPLETESERLPEEIRAIDRASAALANGRALQTLETLDEYDRRYPERRFVPEALYLRMEALRQSGRAADARGVAERLVAAYPESPQAARARLILEQSIP